MRQKIYVYQLIDDTASMLVVVAATEPEARALAHRHFGPGTTIVLCAASTTENVIMLNVNMGLRITTPRPDRLAG